MLIHGDSATLAGMSDEPDWKRLGDFLRRRRIELDHGENNRARFFRDRDLKPGPVRTLTDMENGSLGKRQTFEQSSFDLAEYHYKWKSGSAVAVLRGGDPMPDDDDLNIKDERPPRVAQIEELRRLVERVPDKDIARVRDYLTAVVEQV